MEMLSKTSSSHDGISNKKLKAISKVISFALSQLINLFTKSGHVPDSWKIALKKPKILLRQNSCEEKL
jgi:hypothetical protein